MKFKSAWLQNRCYPKIGESRGALPIQKDITRLEVTVDKPHVVGIRERPHDGPDSCDDIGLRKYAQTAPVYLEILPIYVFH